MSSSQEESPAAMGMGLGHASPLGGGDSPGGVFMFEAKSHWKDSFKVLHEMYESQQMCDVSIRCGEKTFRYAAQ
jgi:hypothetical protein